MEQQGLMEDVNFFQMMKVNCDTAQEYFLQQTIKEKITGNLPHPRCNGSVLVQLATELRQIKEEITSAGGVGVYGGMYCIQLFLFRM